MKKNLLKNLLVKDGEVYLYRNFFNEKESNSYFESLKQKINWQQDKIKIYGKEIPLPRLTAWVGDKSYTYSGIKMKAKPWIKELLAIKEKVEQKVTIKFNGVLLNFYRSYVDSMGWHSDDEVEFGKNAVIGSVSFGQTRIFRFRHLGDYSQYKQRKKKEKLKNFKTEYPNSFIEIALSHGDFLVMQGETQHKWQHEVKKEVNQKELKNQAKKETQKEIKKENQENLFSPQHKKERINLTFRRVIIER